MYDALDVAKYVINYCIDKEEPISNLKLQKVLYFLWVGYFKKTRKRLFNNDIFAWKFGPVIPEIYYEFCMYGSSPIVPIGECKPNKDVSADKDIQTINGVIDKYSKKLVFELVKETHEEGKPWSEANKRGDKIIPFSLIEELECKSW